MSRKTNRLAALALICLLGTVAALAGAATSRAATAPACSTGTLVQPFLSWGDKNSYFMLPGGSFDSGVDWTRSGASVVNGNETFYVNSATDANSLTLAAGDSATSPYVCASTSTPTVRLFVRNTGTASATLKVDILYVNKRGVASVTNIANVTATSAWAPTAELLFLSRIAPLVSAKKSISVAFRFTAVGTGAAFQIDDVYVDPRKSL